MIAFTVLGAPVAQGSMKAFVPKGWSRPIITGDNGPAIRSWRQAVVDAVVPLLGGAQPIAGVGVEVEAVFFVPRAKSAPRSDTVPAKKPDVDKLLRALLDALTVAGVWRDDAVVVAARARKAYAGGIQDPKGPAGLARTDVRIVLAQAQPAVVQPSLLEVTQ